MYGETTVCTDNMVDVRRRGRLFGFCVVLGESSTPFETFTIRNIVLRSTQPFLTTGFMQHVERLCEKLVQFDTHVHSPLAVFTWSGNFQSPRALKLLIFNTFYRV